MFKGTVPEFTSSPVNLKRGSLLPKSAPAPALASGPVRNTTIQFVDPISMTNQLFADSNGAGSKIFTLDKQGLAQLDPTVKKVAWDVATNSDPTAHLKAVTRKFPKLDTDTLVTNLADAMNNTFDKHGHSFGI